MSDHTPTLLSVDGNRLVPVERIDRRPCIATVRACQEGGGDPETLANAERLAAAWNACAGIPTAALEGADVRRLANEIGGCWRGFEYDIREVIGNTNYQLIADLIEPFLKGDSDEG